MSYNDFSLRLLCSNDVTTSLDTGA